MAPVTVEEYESIRGRYVESVTVVRTDSAAYPSGWKYSLHYGTLDGETLLRYDNAHERTKGHERHAGNDVETIEFPGMKPLYRRFRGELQSLSPERTDAHGSDDQ